MRIVVILTTTYSLALHRGSFRDWLPWSNCKYPPGCVTYTYIKLFLIPNIDQKPWHKSDPSHRTRILRWPYLSKCYVRWVKNAWLGNTYILYLLYLPVPTYFHPIPYLGPCMPILQWPYPLIYLTRRTWPHCISIIFTHYTECWFLFTNQARVD